MGKKAKSSPDTSPHHTQPNCVPTEWGKNPPALVLGTTDTSPCGLGVSNTGCVLKRTPCRRLLRPLLQSVHQSHTATTETALLPRRT